MKKFTHPSAIVTILSALLSLAGGIVFQVVNGTFGLMKYNYYNPIIVGILCGGIVAALVLMLCKLPGLASLVTTAVPGVALCMFFALGARPAYWHIVDVFMVIDEPQGFDPMYLTFCGLLVAAFIVGEIAIYLRKPGQAPKAVKG